MNEGERFWMYSISCQFRTCSNWKTVRSEPHIHGLSGGGGEGGVCKVYCRHEREKGEERTVKILQNLAKCLCKVNA